MGKRKFAWKFIKAVIIRTMSLALPAARYGRPNGRARRLISLLDQFENPSKIFSRCFSIPKQHHRPLRRCTNTPHHEESNSPLPQMVNNSYAVSQQEATESRR